jgi:hypothetical protein
MSHIAMRKQFVRNIVSGWVLLVVEVAIAILLTPFTGFHPLLLETSPDLLGEIRKPEQAVT